MTEKYKKIGRTAVAVILSLVLSRMNVGEVNTAYAEEKVMTAEPDETAALPEHEESEEIAVSEDEELEVPNESPAEEINATPEPDVEVPAETENSIEEETSEEQTVYTPSYAFTVYNQMDSRWAYSYPDGKTQFGLHGCGPTAVAMFLSSKGIYMTPPETAAFLSQLYLDDERPIWGWNNGGMFTMGWAKTCDYYGLPYSFPSTTDELVNALASGASCGCGINNAEVYGPHTVLINGYDWNTGYTTVYDPYAGVYQKPVSWIWNSAIWESSGALTILW